MEVNADKLNAFALLVEYVLLENLKADRVDCESNRRNCITTVKLGKTWAKIDATGRGCYMVALVDSAALGVKAGEIVGIKAYGVPHPGHRYGTLDDPRIPRMRSLRDGLTLQVLKQMQTVAAHA